MNAFRFYSSFWLILVPFMLAALWWRFRPQGRPAAVFSSVTDLKGLPVTRAQRLRRVLPYLYGLGLSLVITGLARPQAGKAESRILGQGIAIEIVLDTSGSMEAIDFQLAGRDVSRLEAVKHVIEEFVLGSRASGLSGRTDDLVGLVAFGGFADMQSVRSLLITACAGLISFGAGNAQTDSRQSGAGDQCTGAARGNGNRDRRRSRSRCRSPAGGKCQEQGPHPAHRRRQQRRGRRSARKRAGIAAESAIKLYTIGIGRSGTVPVPQEDEFGNRVLVPAQFRIDEDLLREMAKTGGGRYFHASDSEGLAAVYAEINALEKSEFEETKYSEYTELFAWFAGSGLGVILLIGVLTETRFRSLP